MQLSTFLDWLLFVWLITPGFVFGALAAKRRAQPTESAFYELSRVVLASVLFSALGGVVALGLNAAILHVDLGRMVAEGEPYVRQEFLPLTALVVFQVAVACLLALVGNWFVALVVRRTTNLPTPKLHMESSWSKLLQLRTGTVAYAYVRLKSGVEIRGKVFRFGHDISIADRELTLERPLHCRFPGEGDQEMQWQYLVLQGSEIDTLATKYLSETAWRKSLGKKPAAP